MSLLFEYKPGMSLVDPWLFTVNRAQTAYFIDSTGKLVLAGANTLRDRHYPFGLGSTIRTTLFEASSRNELLQSQALATTPWFSSQQTAVNNASTAPDGTVTATSLIPNAGSRPTLNQYTQSGSITITANEQLAGSIFVKQKGTYNGLIMYLADGASANGCTVQLNLTTGAVISSSAVGTGTLGGVKIIPLANGWFWIGIWGQVSTATPGATSVDIITFLYPDTTFSGTATYDGVQGYYTWGAQVERQAQIGGIGPFMPTSYMPTAAAMTSRSMDQVWTAWPFQTMPAWCYVSYYDLGGSIRANSAPIVTITGPVANQDPTWCGLFMRVNAGVGASYASGVGNAGLIGSNRNTTGNNNLPLPYELVEAFSWVLKDASTKCAVRRNGGTIDVGSATGPLATVPFVDIPAGARLYLGFAGALLGAQCAITSVKLGADPTRITTLTQAAAS